MATTAELDALLSNARDADSCPFVLSEASHASGHDALAALAEAIRTVSAGGWELLGAGPPHLTPSGAASELNGVDVAEDEGEDIGEWFTALAEALTASGWSGTLRPLVWGDRPTEDASAEPWLATTLALSGWTHRERNKVVTPWRSEPALVPPLVDLAMTWVSGVDGDLWFHAMKPVRGTAGEVRSSLLARLTAETGSTFCQVRSQARGRERRVRFSSYGHVTLEERSSDDLGDRLASLRSAWLPWASRVDRTCTTSDVGQSHPSWFVETGRDKLPRWYYPHGRHLDTRRVPDACAEQVLTGEHLEAAHDLGGWEVRRVADDRFLVTHPQPRQWFLPAPDGEQGTRVAPAVLTKARADFGSMLLTDDDRG